MQCYDGLNHSSGIHKIKVNLQNNTYQGSFTYTVGGNCKGMNILDFDLDVLADSINHIKTENCSIQLLNNDFWSVVLTDTATKDTCHYELDDDEFYHLVVGVEIVDFTSDGDKK